LVEAVEETKAVLVVGPALLSETSLAEESEKGRRSVSLSTLELESEDKTYH